MVNKKIVEIINKYIDVIKNYFNIEMVILYGSFARDDEGENSDIDLAIIIEDCQDPDYLEQLRLLWRLVTEVDFRIEPRLYYRGDYDTREEASFLSEIIRTGEVIYNKRKVA